MNDYYDSRQHLNLSRHAYDVIENDKFEFLEKPSRQRVINMILAAYVDDADAAIDNALIRYEERLRAHLSMTANTAEKEALLRALVNAYRQELIDQVKSYPNRTLGFGEGRTHFIYAFCEHEIRGGIKMTCFKLD